MIDTVDREGIGCIRHDRAELAVCHDVGGYITEAKISDTDILTNVIRLFPFDAALKSIDRMEAENAFDKHRYRTECRPAAEIRARGAVPVLV